MQLFSMFYSETYVKDMSTPKERSPFIQKAIARRDENKQKVKKMAQIDYTSTILTAIYVIAVIAVIIIIIVMFKSLVVVPFNEVHVVSRGTKVTQYDGSGRYRYYKFLYGRTIIPKHVLDIEPALIKLHDVDKLPFGVEISVKVQVTDPPKAAQTLTKIDLNTISKVVEDTVMSAARSVAMERNILEIMKDREEIEKAI